MEASESPPNPRPASSNRLDPFVTLKNKKVFTDFMTYTGGIYTPTTQDRIDGHATKVIGYG